MEPADHDLESILLGYEGNALFMNGQHEKSTEILEIGMRLYPHDYRFQRALATVSEKWAEKVLGLERSKRTIEDVRVLFFLVRFTRRTASRILHSNTGTERYTCPGTISSSLHLTFQNQRRETKRDVRQESEPCSKDA